MGAGVRYKAVHFYRKLEAFMRPSKKVVSKRTFDMVGVRHMGIEIPERDIIVASLGEYKLE